MSETTPFDPLKTAACPATWDLIEQLVQLESSKNRLHLEYMGKAMPADVYLRFQKLRDERIPALQSQLRAGLAATPALPATENSSADGLTEAGRTGLSAFLDAAKSAGITHLPGAKELAARFDQAEPFGYVNVYTGQFFNDVEPCRKNNSGHWRTVYTAPQAQPADAQDGARLDFLETQKRREARDGGYSAFYSLHLPAKAAGPWQATHGGEYDHKTLRESIDAAMAAAQEGGAT